jgi:hypothetical protein
LLAGPFGATVLFAVALPHSDDRRRSERPMRTNRFVRTLMVAGPAAVLSILSIVSTVMAASGGGDFPRFK